MKNNNPLAIWSLVLGILSIVFCGPISAVPAIICGHMARSTIKAEPDKWTGDGMAIAGLIMGYFAIVLFVVLFVVGLVAAAALPSLLKTIQDMTNAPSCNVMTLFMQFPRF